MNDVKLEVLIDAKNRADKAFNGLKHNILEINRRVVSLNGALAGIAAVTSFGYVAKRALDATAEIERNAEMAGVAVGAYQELAFASEHYGVTQAAVTDALKELNLRADEFVATAGGSAAEAFQRLGYGQAELNDRLKDAPALLEDIIRRMEGLDRAAQIRIADEIFGGQGGEQFVRMIRAGADGLANLRRRAHDLGVVLDQALIDRSVEAKRQVETLTKVLEINFQKSLVQLAPSISRISRNMTNWITEQRRLQKMGIDNFLDDVAAAASGVASAMEKLTRHWSMGKLGQAVELSKQGVLDLTEYIRLSMDEREKLVDDILAKQARIAAGPSAYPPGEMSEHERRRLGLGQKTSDARPVPPDLKPVSYGWGRFDTSSQAINVALDSAIRKYDLMLDAQARFKGGGMDYQWASLNFPGDAADQMARDIQKMLDRRNKMFEESNRGLTDMTRRTAWEMQGAMSNFFFDAVTGRLESFEDYMQSVLQSLARMASEAIAQIIMQQAAGKAAGGSGGGWVGAAAGFISQILTRDSGGPVAPGGMYEIGVPEMLHTGGKQYLMMGNQDGYVEPLKEGGRGQQSIRIINAVDPSIVEEWANSPSGERVIMNIIRRNQ